MWYSCANFFRNIVVELGACCTGNASHWALLAQPTLYGNPLVCALGHIYTLFHPTPNPLSSWPSLPHLSGDEDQDRMRNIWSVIVTKACYGNIFPIPAHPNVCTIISMYLSVSDCWDVQQVWAINQCALSINRKMVQGSLNLWQVDQLLSYQKKR